jgi:hypothetical protein
LRTVLSGLSRASLGALTGAFFNLPLTSAVFYLLSTVYLQGEPVYLSLRFSVHVNEKGFD